MWTRLELKTNAKKSMSMNYWIFVLAAVVLLLFGAEKFDVNVNYDFNTGPNISVSGVDLIGGDSDETLDDYIGEDVISSLDTFSNDLIDGANHMARGGVIHWIMTSLFAGVTLLVAFAALALKIFVSGPIEVGVNNTFLRGQFGKVEAGSIFSGFTGGSYMNVVFVQFLRGLFTALWTLLFIIPGIIKAYEYRMIPYLLAENPRMDRQTAFATSKAMMMGNKMDAFILDLSFILWKLLSAVTLGIVGIFYVNPYVESTNAQLYIKLKTM